MIIQCEKCQTKFRLDDSRVTEKGVRVRCTKCKYVFTVKKALPVDQPEVGRAGFVPPLILAGVGDAAPPEEQEKGETGSLSALAAVTAPQPLDATTPSSADGGFDFSDFVFGGAEVPVEVPVTASFVAATSVESPLAFPPSSVPVEEQKLETVVEQAPPQFLFNTPEDNEDTFNIADLDFGNCEQTPVTTAAPVSAELTPAMDGKVGQTLVADTSPVGDEESPPFEITTRRKQSPLFGVLLATIAVTVLLGLGYFGYTMFLAPKEIPVVESGKISLRGVTAAFVKNSTAGELLVISGEALNEYAKARAALQVKATVFGGGGTGQSVASKMAYCGNPLSTEQLQSLPLDKIEAAMANQFGDSLANMEVAPGKTIHFVVVLSAVPAGATEYSVQSAGSTVSTGKQ